MNEMISAAMSFIGSVTRRLAAAAHWGVRSVDEEPAPRVVPPPGPAHGPVPSIELRLREGRDRRHAA
jgi:hypothetical protein